MAAFAVCAFRALRAPRLTTSAAILYRTPQSFFSGTSLKLNDDRRDVTPQFHPGDISSAASFDDRISESQVRNLGLVKRRQTPRYSNVQEGGKWVF